MVRRAATCEVEVVEPLSGDASLDDFLASVERRAFRMAELSLGDPEDALDAVQDAMLALVRGYRDRGAEHWTPLFWQILTRRITDVHRRRARRSRLLPLRSWRSADADAELAEDPVETAPAPMAAEPAWRLSAAQRAERVRAALAVLPLRQQQAFLLRYREGLSVAETAAAMECSEGSVKAHCARAVSRLRSELGDPDGVEDLHHQGVQDHDDGARR